MTKNKIWGSVSVLVGIVIAILALLRGPWATALLIVTFSVWGIWVAYTLMKPRLHAIKLREPAEDDFEQHLEGGAFEIPDPDEPALERVLMLHVGRRITDYLHAAYPQAKWMWCEDDPCRLAIDGGTGRIQIYGVPEFDYANVTIDRRANIRCDLVKVVQLGAAASAAATTVPAEVPPNEQVIDPQVWYEMQGRKVLETVQADLSARGFSTLTLDNNGNILVRQGDKLAKKGQLPDYPGQQLLPKLVQVFERYGLAVKVQGKDLILSW